MSTEVRVTMDFSSWDAAVVRVEAYGFIASMDDKCSPWMMWFDFDDVSPCDKHMVMAGAKFVYTNSFVERIDGRREHRSELIFVQPLKEPVT